jgi:GNAT superfamily N-acetyltransferase
MNAARDLSYRFATDADLDLLSEWNHQLIRDEGHRNPMSPLELRERMKGWLAGEYVAVVFYLGDVPVAYALYRESRTEVYLRHLFVDRRFRRCGIGRQAVTILRERIWPRDKRLTVEVLVSNGPAVAFWQAVGYIPYSLTLEIMPE